MDLDTTSDVVTQTINRRNDSRCKLLFKIGGCKISMFMCVCASVNNIVIQSVTRGKIQNDLICKQRLAKANYAL